MKVLIVDDEELLRMNLRAVFEDLGYLVVEGENGRHALEVFAREKPHVVFTDLRMPEMDGLAFIRALKKVSPETPVVVVSGMGTLEDAIQAVRLGAWDYITKPLRQPEEIEITANRVLERARLIAENKAYREHLEELVRQRTEELRDSERRYRTLFESANDAIILAHDGRIVGCNDKALELFDRPREEIVTAPFAELSPEAQPDGTPSQSREASLVEKALGGEAQFFEWQFVKKSGARFDTEISLNRIELSGTMHLQGIIRDITQRKLKDASILKLSTVVEQSANSIMILDTEGRIEYLNPRFYQTTGVSPAEAMGKHPTFLKSGANTPDFFHSLRRQLERGEGWRGEICKPGRNGELVWELTTVTPIKERSGRIMNYVAIGEDITERKRFEERLYRQANFDALTGLPNRYLLSEQLAYRMSQGESLYVMLLDIDNFEYVNDTLGHSQGDEVLRQMGQRLKGLIGEEDILARFMGDQFVLVRKGGGGDAAAYDFARVVGKELNAMFHVNLHEIFVTVSIGIATCCVDSSVRVESLLKNAEAALHKAQKEGVNSVVFFTDEIDQQANVRFSLESRLYKALEREEFVLYYQPQIDIKTKRLSGVEALLRWSPPGEEMIFPERFVRILEETGLIVPVGEWVLREACRQHASWMRSGMHPFSMSVNISGGQFRSGKLPEMVQRALHDFGMSPALLNLELTESILMQDMNETVRMLRALVDLGISLSIDDFGTGYSSLSYLRTMPIHELKVDRSFITSLPEDANSVAIVNTILGMAETLNLSVVAEGVESEAQFDFFSTKICDRIQGAYFSRAIAAEKLPVFVRNAEEGLLEQGQRVRMRGN
ncbi:EAL domain-containing protein [Geomonas sp. RF6]|uniref:GGDEF/EAL domain-containing response regulator n=1 Tax=Geomonas sp. RF6 TaxID=2897342 RepID=UPI001E545C0B|nr:EAL domain-containing protein [Geomonas sp. RF6]UFS69422.1 EAL domain-containing protein [Geomonas sp. RF6]